MWVYVVLFLITAYLALDRILYRKYYAALGNSPGPKIWFSFFGTGIILLSVKDPRDFFQFTTGLWKKYGPILQVSLLRRIVYLVSSHDNAEVVMSSNTLLEKGSTYDFTIPWIGRGLLTSTGEKWKSRRKMLTPAFHFSILNEFVDVFNKNGVTLCKLLEKEVDRGPFNIYPYMQLAALDNIYETAMGVSKDIQNNPDTKYVKAVKDISFVISQRAFNPLHRLEIFHRFTSSYRLGKSALKFLHETTEGLIAEKKKEFTMKSKEGLIKEDEGYGGKKRVTFLDLLLTEAAGNKLNDSDVREEVDTFLFEGHDTVTSGLSFCAYQLAEHPQFQEKAYQEQLDIFGDSDRLPTFNDLQEMKYLEKIIKETQRLYPSVPFIERYTREPVTLSGDINVPGDSQITIFIYALHRDPAVWNDPDTFNPENFTPEASQKRNPYAYVPFSAGPRNCIGQRFAMMELKCTFSKILRKFRLLPSPRPEHKLYLMVELVLNSKTGHHVQLQRRK